MPSSRFVDWVVMPSFFSFLVCFDDQKHFILQHTFHAWFVQKWKWWYDDDSTFHSVAFSSFFSSFKFYRLNHKHSRLVGDKAPRIFSPNPTQTWRGLVLSNIFNPLDFLEWNEILWDNKEDEKGRHARDSVYFFMLWAVNFLVKIKTLKASDSKLCNFKQSI